MIELEDLQIELGDFRLAADLAIAPGLTAVIGPSGAGKSTLLGVIGGFVEPSGGSLRIMGDDVAGRAPGQRPVAQLFQDGNLFPHLTVLENLALGIGPRLRVSAEDRARLEAALARVGLSGLGGRRPGALSGGQQSRAALARVLVQDKPVVLLDEPFGALGPALRREMLDLAREVLAAPGRTVLMVTHDPEDAERVAESVILVMDGRATGPFDRAALFADPPPALRAYLG